MYKALYRAYRPETFNEVLGQEHIVRILQNQIQQDSVNHAYLFCGTRGTGKTTIARLLAKGVNCLDEVDKPCGMCANCKSIQAGSFMDLIEVDAASNNGIDNIRELRESVNYPPTIGSKKVYIIDEVHMLSTNASNALLKTLEEPPEHVIFVLCTTEPERLLPTILSRCMRLDFRRVSEKDLTDRVNEICSDLGIDIESAAVDLIVAGGDGSARDCISILDRCVAGSEGKVTKEDCLDILGAAGDEAYIELTKSIENHDPSKGLEIIGKLINLGKDPRQILQGWINHFRNLMMIKFVKNPGALVSMSEENIKRMSRQAELMPLDRISQGIVEVAKTLADAKYSSQARVLLEVCLVKLATTYPGNDLETVIKKVIPVMDYSAGTGSANSNDPKGNFSSGTNNTIDNDKSNLADDNKVPLENIGSENQLNDNEPIKNNEYMSSDEVLPREDSHDLDNDIEMVNLSQEVESSEGRVDFAIENNSSDENEVQASKVSIDDVWRDILDEGEKIQSTFSIVRVMAFPVSMNDSEIVIDTGDLGKEYIEGNRNLVQDLLEKYTGSKKKIIYKGKEEDLEKAGRIASQVSELLGGVDVKVK